MAVTPTQITDATMPGPEHRDAEGCCWWGQPCFTRNGQWHAPCWFYGEDPDTDDTHWAPHDAFPVCEAPPEPEPEPAEPEETWATHPSLTPEERNRR